MEVIDFVIKALEKEAKSARRLDEEIKKALNSDSPMLRIIDIRREIFAVPDLNLSHKEKLKTIEALQKEREDLEKEYKRREKLLSPESIEMGCAGAVWARELEDEIARLKYKKSKGYRNVSW